MREEYWHMWLEMAREVWCFSHHMQKQATTCNLHKKPSPEHADQAFWYQISKLLKHWGNMLIERLSMLLSYNNPNIYKEEPCLKAWASHGKMCKDLSHN